MADLRIDIRGDFKELRAFMDGYFNETIPNVMKETSRTLALSTLEKAKANVESRSRYHGKNPGQLVNSMAAVNQGKTGKFNFSWVVLARAPYASFVEGGTREHEIPNNWAFGAHDPPRIHPGAEPMRFFEDAFLEAASEATDVLERVYEEKTKRHKRGRR